MPNKIIHISIATCILIFCTLQAHSTAYLPKSTNVPGGIVILNLESTSNSPPEVYYQDKRALVIPNPNKHDKYKWISVVGIPLDAKTGTHNITIHSTTGITNKSFNVQSKIYPQERLTITNKRKVQPFPEDLAIIEAQYLETIQTYKHWEYRDIDSIKLSLPVKGRKSSPFGFTRIINNIPKNPHSGLDIAAAKGTKVKVAKPGTVINTGNFFYSGNIVFVDHGQGLITSYCHLDSITVVKGQKLAADAIVGTVGNTGRATGPHLHWSVNLNGVRVDPQLFINDQT